MVQRWEAEGRIRDADQVGRKSRSLEVSRNGAKSSCCRRRVDIRAISRGARWTECCGPRRIETVGELTVEDFEDDSVEAEERESWVPIVEGGERQRDLESPVAGKRALRRCRIGVVEECHSGIEIGYRGKMMPETECGRIGLVRKENWWQQDRRSGWRRWQCYCLDTRQDCKVGVQQH